MESNRGFFSLPPEDRAAAYEAAEDRAGTGPGSFFDLSPEERGYAYDQAVDRAEGLY